MNFNEEYIVKNLSKNDYLYLKTSKCSCNQKYSDDGSMSFLAIYKIDEITFEDKAPRKEALENVISSMNIKGVNFVYIIKGNSKGVSFYYGIARDYNEEPAMEIYDIGTSILKPSLQGNFRGSKISELDANEKKSLLKEISNMDKAKILEGVPGINKDDENFQSVDRIIDVMLGNDFVLMLIAKPLSQNEIISIQDKIYDLYNKINPISKSSFQESSGKSTGTSKSDANSISETKGTNNSNTEQTSEGFSKSNAKGKNSSTNKSTSRGTNKEETVGGNRSTVNTSGQEGSSNGISETYTDSTSNNKSTSNTIGSSKSQTKGSSKSTSENIGTNTGITTTFEFVNKKIQEWIKYIDDVILPRIDYGIGKGLFLSSAILLGNNEADLIKLENTIRSVYGGESGNRMPLKAYNLDSNEITYIKRMQIPILTYKYNIEDNENKIRTVCSQFICNSNSAMLGNWMSSNELSLMAGLPQKEIVGLALREEVDFGLNIAKSEKEPVLLGHLIQSGIVLNGKNGTPNIEVKLEKEYFDKHIFVTGVTGSGKTTTCQKLLLESKENFMVIEPAKTEYRVLTEKFPDMLVFTLGKENAAPFRLNPFEFLKGENITSRVDMIKASMEASFDMEAAIPQILEAAIYECYEDKGWNISTNKNRNYENPFDGNVQAFPTLSDLDKKIKKVVEEQGFDNRLKSDYIGSIRARLKGLMVGAKGIMLDTPRSIDFVELLDKKVVFELDNIKSTSEKSLIMGFILSNLSEAIKEKYNKDNKQINHITLIEEAHRLLSKYMPGDSLNKKQGVEMFTDMLAEVRKYGESLIIVDQIPNKLTPEVLKNTNTKIVHKIFAQDDKEAIGNTMALKDEQKEYLSYLECGSAIMMNPGLSKAIQVKIMQTEENNTNRIPPKDEDLRIKCLEYYLSIYKKGIIFGLEKLKNQLTIEQLELYLLYFQYNSEFIYLYNDMVIRHSKETQSKVISYLREINRKLDINTIFELIKIVVYDINQISKYPNFDTILKEFITCLIERGTEFNLSDYKNIDYIEAIKNRGR